MIDIYTDGACKNNPGPGGWGFILVTDTEIIEKSGPIRETTNNRMELLAALKALRFCKEYDKKVTIYTDSMYVKNGITVWVYNWLKSNFKNRTIKNYDLWIELLEATKRYKDLTWVWVKGHSGHYYNERVDKLATTAIQSIS